MYIKMPAKRRATGQPQRGRNKKRTRRMTRPSAMDWAPTVSRGVSAAIRPISLTRRFFYASQNWNTTTVNGFWNVLQPRFNEMPNLAEYQALFREYKLNRIKVTFVPRYDSTDQTGAGTGAAMPLISYRVVNPEFLTPSGVYNNSTLNAYLETGAKTRAFRRPISVFFRPTIATDIADQVVASRGPMWTRNTTAGAAVLHNGVSYFVHFNGFVTPTANFTTDVYYTYYFQLRNPA